MKTKSVIWKGKVKKSVHKVEGKMGNVREKVETPKIPGTSISQVNSLKLSGYQQDLIHVSFKLDQNRKIKYFLAISTRQDNS